MACSILKFDTVNTKPKSLRSIDLDYKYSLTLYNLCVCQCVGCKRIHKNNGKCCVIVYTQHYGLCNARSG